MSRLLPDGCLGCPACMSQVGGGRCAVDCNLIARVEALEKKKKDFHDLNTELLAENRLLLGALKITNLDPIRADISLTAAEVKRVEALEAVTEAAKELQSDFVVFDASDGERGIRVLSDEERHRLQARLVAALAALEEVKHE